MRFRLSIWCSTLLCVVCLIGTVDAQESNLETKSKAAYLYLMAEYVTWPAGTFKVPEGKQARIVVGFVGPDPNRMGDIFHANRYTRNTAGERVLKSAGGMPFERRTIAYVARPAARAPKAGAGGKRRHEAQVRARKRFENEIGSCHILVVLKPAYKQREAEDVLGTPLTVFLAEDEQSEFEARMATAIQAMSHPPPLQLSIATSKGCVKHVLIASSLKSVDGRATGLVSILSDITAQYEAESARERLEAELRQSHKMEAVGRLAGGIAHDFNNLLTVIIGSTELLNLGDGQNREIGDDILAAGNRAADLTRQLLAFSRKSVLSLETVSLSDIIDSTQSMLSRLIGASIDVITNHAPDLWLVRADPSQITQVLVNLALNARDAIADTGTIRIETRNVTIDDQVSSPHPDLAPGQYVSLTVEDTGSGMDHEIVAKIFEPFFTTKEQGKGTGLGLSTVFGIVKQSGGVITVNSYLGDGTRFSIFLPRSHATKIETDHKEPGLDIAASGQGTILVAEDEDSVRRLATRVLEDAGFTVISACTGEEALQEFARLRPRVDLLLTDAVMPKMGGLQLVKRLRAKTTGMGVIIMSGYLDLPLAKAHADLG